MLDDFRGHHGAHIRASRRVANHARASANQGNRLVACHLKTLHQAKRHKVAYVEAVSCRVETDIEYGLSLVDHFLNFFFVGYLGNKASGNQFFVNLHGDSLLFLLSLFYHTSAFMQGLDSYIFYTGAAGTQGVPRTRISLSERKKAPPFLKRTKPVSPVLPPDVHRQLTLPASSSTGARLWPNARIL